MRASAKWIFGILAAAFVGWMVFDVGMGVSGQGGGVSMTDAVIRVNGHKIDLQTYYAVLRQAQDQQRQQGAAIGESLEDQRALEDAVVENLIQDILLQDEYKRRGIHVTDQEIVQLARTAPPPEIMAVPDFQTDGQFDLTKYQTYLASTADVGFLQAIENRYRQEIPRIKLFEQLTSDLYVSDARLWAMYRDAHDSVTIRLLQIQPDAAVPDSAIGLTDDEARAYYNAHREDFSRPAIAYTSYVTVPRTTTAADTAAALARAREIRDQILAGADFATFARTESADSAGPTGGSAANGGDLGMVPRGSFVPAFEQAALSLRPGQISEPVLTPFGFHLIRLESATRDSLHASHILIPIEPAGEHLIRIEALADTLDLLGAEQSDPAALDDVANLLGLPVLQAQPVLEGSRVIAGTHLVPDAGLWAFDAVPGETSPVIEAPEAYYLFRLDSLKPAGVPPFDEVEAAVRRADIDARKLELARQLADSIAGELRSGEPLMQTALRHVLGARTLGPMTRVNPDPAVRQLPEVVGAAFGLGVGEAGGPIETDNGIFFVETAARILADSSAWLEQLDTQRQAALRALQEDRIRRFLASLRDRATVVDRRREIDRAQKEVDASPDRNPFNPLG